MSSKTSRYKLLQNWTNYNESAIWDITHEYYKNKGITAFSKSSNNLIPNDITTNYQSARAFAELVKTVIDENPSQEKVKVLEVGAGSGYFSRNFLYACQDLGILNKVEFLVSDYSVTNLQEIQSYGLLSDFIEGENYKFIELDVCNLKSAKDLEGNSYKLENISASILNYVLDVLPATVLRHKNNQAGLVYEELQMRLMQHVAEEKDLVKNSHYLTNLHKETRFTAYDFLKESLLEKEFSAYFTEYYKDIIPPEELIVYHYGSMHAMRSLLSVTAANGFVLSSDIPFGKTGFCQIVGNALAHEVDAAFIGFFAEKLGYHSYHHTDKVLSRLMCRPARETDHLEKTFDKVFKQENLVNRYTDIRAALNDFKHKESMDCMKMLLEKFEHVAKHSIYPSIYWGNYYNTLGDKEKAIEAYKQAKEVDFLNNYNLDSLIKNLAQ